MSALLGHLGVDTALQGLLLVAFWAWGFPSLVVLLVALAEHAARRSSPPPPRPRRSPR